MRNFEERCDKGRLLLPLRSGSGRKEGQEQEEALRISSSRRLRPLPLPTTLAQRSARYQGLLTCSPPSTSSRQPPLPAASLAVRSSTLSASWRTAPRLRHLCSLNGFNAGGLGARRVYLSTMLAARAPRMCSRLQAGGPFTRVSFAFSTSTIAAGSACRKRLFLRRGSDSNPAFPEESTCRSSCETPRIARRERTPRLSGPCSLR